MRIVWPKQSIVFVTLLLTATLAGGGLAALPGPILGAARGDTPRAPALVLTAPLDSSRAGVVSPIPPAPDARTHGRVSAGPRANAFDAAGPYAEIIERAAASQGVDPNLVRAVIQVESRFQPQVRSPQGAMGLMQLSPDIVKLYAVRDPFDPRANIEGGSKYLKRLLGHFDLTVALAAYNAGEAAVDRFRGVPPFPETRSFINQVLVAMGGSAN